MRKDGLEFLRCPRTGQRLDLAVHEADGDEVVLGVLESEAASYPVVAGIPVFIEAGAAALPDVRAGRGSRAAAEVFCATSSRSRRWRLAQAMDGFGTARSVAASLRKREVDQMAELVESADGGSLALLEGAFLRGRSTMPDAFAYFRYRLGTPRHLVALSLFEALPAPHGLVGDFGCGGGHLTWAMAAHWPSAHVVALDAEFPLLLAARLMVGPLPTLVCADITRAPLAPGALDLAFSFDVLSYVAEKRAVVREMEQAISSEGTVAITSVKDAAAGHVFAGLPLSIEGWRGLVEHLDHRVVRDDVILERYLDGKGLPADDTSGGSGPSQNVTLLASRSRLDLACDRDFAAWPHARGPLGVNPLYEPVGGVGGVSGVQGASYERRVPSGVYAQDNPEVLTYLPDRFQLSAETLAAARRGDTTPELDRLTATPAVLAYPDAYQQDRWPAPTYAGTARP